MAGVDTSKRMTLTSLAKQLKVIQEQDRIVRGVPSGLKKRPSFVFDEAEAADIDNESIYELGMEGFHQLCEKDRLLAEYREILFSPDLVEFDISLQTAKERAESKQIIRDFLLLLSPHFKERNSHKVLEWMVRKWRVNEAFVDELIASILPFHDTKEFVRMLQIVFFTQDSKWWFLYERVKQDGQAISRTLLAQRCHVDPSLLAFAMDNLQRILELREHNVQKVSTTTFISFVTFIHLEYIALKPVLEQPEGLHVYQNIEAMLYRCPMNEEVIVGSMMVFMSLLEKIALSERAIENYLKSLTKFSNKMAIDQAIFLTCARAIEGGYLNHLNPSLATILAKMDLPYDALLARFKLEDFRKSIITGLEQAKEAGSEQVLEDFRNKSLISHS